MIARTVFLLMFLCLGACAAVPEGAQRITFNTASPAWFDQLGDHLPPVRGAAYLDLPQTGQAPYPAVIILHTSQGLGTDEWSFARRLTAEGIAVLAVDSFGPRGLIKIEGAQTQVSEASILEDLYAARDQLLRDPRIDGSRVAVLGFSKGGLPAIYSAFNEIDRLYNHGGPQFAAHAAFHPWCGLRLADLTTTGAPIEIHSGADDTITPPSLCRGLMDEVLAADSGAHVEMNVYEGAGHAFEHPILEHLPPLAVTYDIPRRCRIIEGAGGVFIETSQHKTIDSSSFADVIAGCSEKGGRVKGNPDAAEKAIGRTLDFLKKALFAPAVKMASGYGAGQ